MNETRADTVVWLNKIKAKLTVQNASSESSIKSKLKGQPRSAPATDSANITGVMYGAVF